MARTRIEMISSTRGKLLEAGRRAFATKGYAGASMDDLTAEAGLTRGALYHHFGDKKGLLAAVIAQIDAEMSDRLSIIVNRAETSWSGFVDECVAYIEMALEPEIQRVMLLDGPAVLGDPSQWPSQSICISNTTRIVKLLIDEGILRPLNPEATARLVSGAALSASLWIANAQDPKAVSQKTIEVFLAMTLGLRNDRLPTD